MKYQVNNRRGFAIIIPLVIMGILSVLFSVMLQQMVWDRAQFDSQMNREQMERLKQDGQKEVIQKRFVEGNLPMTTRITCPNPHRQGPYLVTVQKEKDSTSLTVERIPVPKSQKSRQNNQ